MIRIETFIKAMNKHIENNQDLINKVIEYHKSIRERTGLYFYSFIENIKRVGLVERIFALKSDSKGIKVQEVLEVSENYTLGKNIDYLYGYCCSKFVVAWNKKGYRGNYYHFDYEESLSNYKGFDEKTLDKMYCICINQDDVANIDISLKYYNYNNKVDMNIMNYIKLYRKYPILEMVSKLELKKMLHERALKTITENKTFRKYLFINREQCKWLAFQTCYNAFKKGMEINPLDYANSLQYRIDCGKENKIRDKRIKDKIYKYTTQEKLRLYMENNSIDGECYNDYIEACDYLQLDLSDTKVLFPNDFKTMHDNYCEQYFRDKEYKECITYESISKKMRNVALDNIDLEYSNGIYVVRFAKEKRDLIVEGKNQGNCVGRMNYDERQADGKSIIGFVRKCNALDESYITMELDLKTYKIKQFYEAYNKLPANQEILDFKEEYLGYIKETLKHRIELRE